MRRTASQIRTIARVRLHNHRVRSMAVCLLAGLMGAWVAGGLFCFFVQIDFGAVYELPLFARGFFLSQEPISQACYHAIIACSIAWILLKLFVGSALELGLHLFHIQLCKGDGAHVGVLFSRFGIFIRAIALNVCLCIRILLWSLLLLVPGIVAAYRYALAPYLLAEHPQMGVHEAIERSKALMEGNKARLLCLHVSYLGWIILCVVTVGVASLWLMPDLNTASAAFYLEVTHRFELSADCNS